MGLANYIKNICLKYQEMDKTFLTTKEALSMMKACKELVTVQKMRNLESKLATLNKEQVRFNFNYKIHINLLKIIFGKVNFF